MKTTLIGASLFVLTAAAVVFYPAVNSNGYSVAATPNPTPAHVDPVRVTTPVAVKKPKIDVVFVLDTTGSMSGLIHAAKEKIWSIATSMTSAQPAPEIRIGLVAYRDRGDAYVTRVVDLSSDIDTVYATLMQFAADGGGDGPESVNQALNDAVTKIAWSQDANTYKVVFLVGDAPPHMDYQNEVKYPETLRIASAKGIIVNTIQCGTVPETQQPWQQIAALSQGSYFRVDQAGSAVALTTPFDADLARLSAELDSTRLYYGTPEVKERQSKKVGATEELHARASEATKARRAAFNASASGRTNAIGDHELVADVASGRVDLAKVEVEKLPEPLQALSVEERKALVAKKADQRAQLEREIKSLAGKREEYAAAKVAAAGGAKASLDVQLYDAVKVQAKDKGLAYPAAPKY